MQVSFLKSIETHFIKVLQYNPLVSLVLICVLYREISKTSEVHPQESHVLILEEPFFHLFSVLIHGLSYHIKVPLNLVVVSATLQDINSIHKLSFFIFIDVNEQISFKQYYSILL
jgi:hypothetical protein